MLISLIRKLVRLAGSKWFLRKGRGDYMQIRATKVFAKELTKQLKGNYCIESVELVKIPRGRAYIVVGSGYSDIDIDWDDNTVKVLKVNYKPECYAMSQYVTTGELCKLARGLADLTMENYISAFKNAYEI